ARSGQIEHGMGGWPVYLDAFQRAVTADVYRQLQAAVDLASRFVGIMLGTQQLYLLAPGLDVFRIVHRLGGWPGELSPGLRVVSVDALFQRADLGIQYQALLVTYVGAGVVRLFEQIRLLAFRPCLLLGQQLREQALLFGFELFLPLAQGSKHHLVGRLGSRTRQRRCRYSLVGFTTAVQWILCQYLGLDGFGLAARIDQRYLQ